MTDPLETHYIWGPPFPGTLPVPVGNHGPSDAPVLLQQGVYPATDDGQLPRYSPSEEVVP